jgi:hypothetical protein
VEEILHRAERLEKEYDWVGAAESYEKALNLLPEDDFSRMGQAYERLGYAFYRAAMQAESQEEFRERMRRAIGTCERAHELYRRLIDKQKSARMLRCEAVVNYLGNWLTSVPSEKRKLLDECLELEGKALEVFLESGDMLEYGKTYNELSLAFFCRFFLEWDRQTARSIVKRGIEWGEKAVAALSELGNSYEIARAHFTLATCLTLLGGSFIAEPEEIEKNRLKIVKYLSKTAEFSEKLDDAYLLGSSHLWWGVNTGGEEAVKHYEKTIEYGKQARDNFLFAWGLDFLAWSTYWKAIATEDPEKRREMAEKAMQLYDRAQHYYSVILYASPRYGVIAPPTGYAEYYLHSAEWETDPGKRLELLEKSEKAGMEALKEAEASDMPFIVHSALHVFSKIFEARAYVELDPVEKRSYLEKALKYREKTIEVIDQLTPFDYWDRGVMQNYLAEIKWLLAEIEPNLDSKRRLLEEAVLSKERCIELCDKMAPYYERTGDISLFAALQGYQDTYVTVLTRLYDITNNPEHLKKAIEISQKAIESGRKLDMISRMAESYWEMAKAQDILGDRLKAAENFKHASESYMKAAEKIPQLKSFYQDHAVYMNAWTEIEKARHHHERQEYGLAKEHFEKAANLHKSLKKWSYLASNYSGWANVEGAEDLSRKEQCEEAIQAFEQAVRLFDETKKSIQNELSKIEDVDEKRMANSMVKATDVRQEYCMARIVLEQARKMDKEGDHYSSSEKYGSAAEAFEKIGESVESNQERREIKFTISLSRAWQKMTLAEAKSSPALYIEASQLFEQTEELSPNEKTKMLVLGHSHFCRALEAGTKYVDTRDPAMHIAAVQQLASASNYYIRADFLNASEYAKATKLLFDAYAYMDNAERESDPDKKAKLYTMVEKVLQTSAGSYTKAEHPEKREQVLKLLEKAREERELATSLTEVLHAPSIVSTTRVLTAPTPTQEEAVGSERFEHADIQANLIIRQKELKIGENLNIELELVNAGKGSALLTKVTEIIPKGFELAENPENYRVEDSYLNLKGKRLDPLKTEEVKLVLKPTAQGTFSLKPTVLYLDENGKYKSHEPEPAMIIVKELGIKGWLKGER